MVHFVHIAHSRGQGATKSRGQAHFKSQTSTHSRGQQPTGGRPANTAVMLVPKPPLCIVCLAKHRSPDAPEPDGLQAPLLPALPDLHHADVQQLTQLL